MSSVWTDLMGDGANIGEMVNNFEMEDWQQNILNDVMKDSADDLQSLMDDKIGGMFGLGSEGLSPDDFKEVTDDPRIAEILAEVMNDNSEVMEDMMNDVSVDEVISGASSGGLGFAKTVFDLVKSVW